MLPLVERFFARLSPAHVLCEPALARALRARLEAAERATSQVLADPTPFCAQLADLLAASETPHEDLARLHVEDLYFAWALSRHERAALMRFEREFLAPLPLQIPESRELSTTELQQQVRTRLFVAEPDRTPRIAQYTGKGPFGAFLRMVGKRIAIDLVRARGGSPARELEHPAVATDPELDYLKLRHAGDFKEALETALGKLDARQVTLLKLSYLEELPPSAIGTMYGVSARTVQRWLVDLKEQVLAQTRSELKARLSLTPAELDSLLGLLQSRMHVSLHRVLGTKAD